MKPALKPLKKNSLNPEKARKELQSLVSGGMQRNGVARRIKSVLPPSNLNYSLDKKSGNGYIYLYDTYVQDPEYKNIIANIEKRLRDFEIFGKTIKLSSFTNPKVLIEDEMRHGASTVVMVGNDDTFIRILSRAADLNVTFGFIPVGQKRNHFAEVLGMPLNEKACEVISARKIEKLDYATINEKFFFICYLYIPSAKLRVQCDENFTADLRQEKFEVAIANLLPPPFESQRFHLHPQDGQMEIYFRPAGGGILSGLMSNKNKRKISTFFFKKILLKMEKPALVVADGRESKEAMVSIEINKKKLALIVGKNRQF